MESNVLGKFQAAAFTLGKTYLVVLEDDSFSSSSNLKTFKYDAGTNTMALVSMVSAITPILYSLWPGGSLSPCARRAN